MSNTAGIAALRRIQLIKEASLGTDAAASARLIGKLGMKLNQTYYRPNDQETGRLSEFERSYPVGVMAELPFEGDATYEQIGYLLGMSLKGAVTGAGGASPYLWAYTPALNAAAAPDTYTLEYGDDVQAWESHGCFARGIEFSGSLDDTLKVKADIVGQSMSTTTFTAALSNPTALTPVAFGTGKLYLDTSWATLGNTQLTETLIDLNIKITPGITPVKYADGSLYYTQYAEKKRHMEIEATFALNSTVAALFASYIAGPQTNKFVRVKFTGPAISGGFDALQFQACVIIDQWPELSDRDGQDVVKLKMVSINDQTTTPGHDWDVALTNALATLP